MRRAIVTNVLKKFAAEKEKWMRNHFKIKAPNKWFIYSPKLFSRREEEQRFVTSLKKHKIAAISFRTALREVYDSLTYFGYDSARQYIFLFKKMGYKTDET